MADLSPIMQRVLAEQRETLNAMFRVQASMHRQLRTDDFYAVLIQDLAPVVTAIEAAGGPVGQVFRPLYELALTLTARSLLGPQARLNAVTRCWRELFPKLGQQLGTHPQLAMQLSNAAFHLNARPYALDAWLNTMTKVATCAPSASALSGAGQVAAWSSGLAHLRSSALAVWETLDGPLSRITIGLEADNETPRDTLRQQLKHPFLRPGSVQDPRLQAVGAVGGFRGFGGSFLQPPTLTVRNHAVFARDQAGTYQIFADTFGATVERAPLPKRGPKSKHPQTPFVYEPSGHITAFGTRREFPHLAGATAAVGTAELMAVALPHSHQVWIVAWAA